MLIDFMFYTYNAAVTTSDIYDRRMFRSGGAGSNIPHGLSSRRAVTSCPTMGARFIEYRDSESKQKKKPPFL